MADPKQSFGGRWTAEKLTRLQKYLQAYVQIMKNQKWCEYCYIDAFAGSLIYEAQKKAEESHRFVFRPGTLKRITFSPWLHDAGYDAVKRMITENPVMQTKKWCFEEDKGESKWKSGVVWINKSTVCNNPKWIDAIKSK